ncbi:MAG TPA: polysaccharide pyruvyl transferase family protein [Clostridiales bacterium]|nr:MAG: Polysaccharide pyruvyl transferase [Firmicutes bacterium ADurb.Bin262]HOU09986.1 polysaccharide pyruvyl transferase family protein [Clostridiales bacterium]HQH62813.1 polysaccharide pyruvyl transferase family protein [Clostridiales bacterium]HQK72444.1 polysaccharide pyruvyl transferase family protein [Clostridiales bacterium]
MKKVGIITFHAAHNFGSSLQVYALQNVIEQLGFDCRVIDFRKPEQSRHYAPLTGKKLLYALRFDRKYLYNLPARMRAYAKYQSFIEKQLHLTKRTYSDLKELYDADFDFDFYISGSDQIWNFKPCDADNAYFLPFVKSGKKIAYAPSFGSRYISVDSHSEIAEFIKQYDSVCVRDDNSATIVRELTGLDVPVLPDPSLLLKPEEWDRILPPFQPGDNYIFYYSLAERTRNQEMVAIANKVAEKTGLKIVLAVCAYGDKEVFSDHDGHIFKLDSGPQDFVNLIKNARFVITSSFHGLLFSVMFNKPFLAFNGMLDERLKSFLSQTGLLDRAVSKSNADEILDKLFDMDFVPAQKIIAEKRAQAIRFLERSLGV